MIKNIPEGIETHFWFIPETDNEITMARYSQCVGIRIEYVSYILVYDPLLEWMDLGKGSPLMIRYELNQEESRALIHEENQDSPEGDEQEY